jgi:glyoxylate reductase
MLGRDVYGKTLGIIGLGRIGEAVARRARGFNMKILYYDEYRKLELEEKLNVQYVSLETLLKESDFITIHIPLTEKTRHMISERELSLMKPTAYLINTSRGPVVDEKALIKALKHGKIAGAGLDVYEKEPIGRRHPFVKLSNVVLLPHIGSASVETRMKMAVMAAQNLVNVLLGKMPLSLVNRELLAEKPLAST